MSFKPYLQTSMLPGTRPDICLSRPPASAPPVTSTHGARQVKNYDKEQYDHARGDDYDAPVTVYDNITVREGVHDAPAVLNYIVHSLTEDKLHTQLLALLSNFHHIVPPCQEIVCYAVIKNS